MSQPFHPDHGRRSLRLAAWDYRERAYYFVTLCTAQRRHVFDDEVAASITRQAWMNIPAHPAAAGVALNEWVLMPNHLHGLLLLPGGDADAEAGKAALPVSRLAGAAAAASPRAFGGGLAPGSLGAIIGSFKSVVSRRVHAAAPGRFGSLWQRGYYEHIVRDAQELERIRAYIRENPIRWADDRDNLDGLIGRMTGRGI